MGYPLIGHTYLNKSAKYVWTFSGKQALKD